MTKYLYLLLIFPFLFACSGDAGLKSIQIGKQVWMTENLSADHFRNGDLIPQAKTQEEWMIAAKEGKPVWCYPMNSEENNQKYGKLYNWYAVTDPRGIAPAGWHVPSDDEWKQLTDFLGGEIAAALSMRETGLDNIGISGFSGSAGGGCKFDGTFFGFGSHCNWWTSTPTNEEYAWMRQLNYIKCTINTMPYSKQYGLSVRCLK